jgi:hypothetical protein
LRERESELVCWLKVKDLGEGFGQLICVVCVEQQQATKLLLFAWEKGKNRQGEKI